jgi:hypothetical protein
MSGSTEERKDDRYQELAARIVWEEHGSVERADLSVPRITRRRRPL